MKTEKRLWCLKGCTDDVNSLHHLNQNSFVLLFFFFFKCKNATIETQVNLFSILQASS